MKKIIFLLIIALAWNGCKKYEDETAKFTTGTYTGEKAIYYYDSRHESLDTITINFNDNLYSYLGSDALDYGEGEYNLKNNSIEFNDDEVRNTLYSWEWIINGTYNFRINGDSLILNQNGTDIKVTCRLKKIPEALY